MVSRHQWRPDEPGRRSKAAPPEFESIQQAAEHVGDFLITKKRGDKTIVVLKDSAPQWVEDTAFEAHAGMIADDYKYEYINEALDRFFEEDDPDVVFENIEADVYNYDLLTWVASHGERPGYVDEATQEIGHSDLGMIGDLMLGQIREKDEVFGIIRMKLEDLVRVQ